MYRHTQYVSKPPKAIYRDYLSQRTTACTQHTTTHLVIDHSMFQPNTINVSETSVTENRKSPAILNTNRPDIWIRKVEHYELLHWAILPLRENRMARYGTTSVTDLWKIIQPFQFVTSPLSQHLREMLSISRGDWSCSLDLIDHHKGGVQAQAPDCPEQAPCTLKVKTTYRVSRYLNRQAIKCTLTWPCIIKQQIISYT